MMKTFFITLLSLSFVSTVMASGDKLVSYEELPDTAKLFVKTYFDPLKVLSVRSDLDWDGVEYKVQLDNGATVNFDNNGNWGEINAFSGVPQALIPSEVASYIEAHHQGQHVISVDKDILRFEVKLKNGLELIFDSKYRFLRYDD